MTHFEVIKTQRKNVCQVFYKSIIANNELRCSLYKKIGNNLMLCNSYQTVLGYILSRIR